MTRPLRAEVSRALLQHGIACRETSDPGFIRAFLNELYTFQVRELKFMHQEAEQVLGPQPLEGYRSRVQSLKQSYPLLSLPIEKWLAEKS